MLITVVFSFQFSKSYHPTVGVDYGRLCSFSRKLMSMPGGGTLYIFGWGSAAGTLKPLPYTKPCSADFATLYTRLDAENPYPIPDLLFLELYQY